MTTPIPTFNICCIDFRFDGLATQYFKETGNEFNYFLGTTAGAALPLGYKEYCIKNCSHGNNYGYDCSSCSCHKKININENNDTDNSISQHLCEIQCNPDNLDMELLKNSLIKNLEIALTLQPITDVYLLNHQDCGAIKAYLAYSGYPVKLGDDNHKEIEINTFLLNYAAKYVFENFALIKNIKLGLIDINGSVANFYNDKWVVTFRGVGINPLGLWYGK